MLFNIQQDNIGSGNGVSPDGTKPLPEPTLTYHQRGRLTFIPGYCVVEFSRHQHWNGNVFILMKFSSLAALEVVKMTTSSAASD